MRLLKGTLFICLFAAISCTFKLTPVYDDSISTEVRQLARTTDSCYHKWMSTPNITYTQCVSGYDLIEVQGNSIVLKEETRPLAKNFANIANRFMDKFKEYRLYHQNKNKATNGELSSFNNDLQGLIKPLLKSEQSLKK